MAINSISHSSLFYVQRRYLWMLLKVKSVVFQNTLLSDWLDEPHRMARGRRTDTRRQTGGRLQDYTFCHFPWTSVRGTTLSTLSVHLLRVTISRQIQDQCVWWGWRVLASSPLLELWEWVSRREGVIMGPVVLKGSQATVEGLRPPILTAFLLFGSVTPLIFIVPL